MILVNGNQVVKAFGSQIILDGADFQLFEGDRVGLIGRNGMGKSTLFRMILGQDHPERGDLAIASGLNAGYIPQMPEFNGEKTMIEEVLSVFSDVDEMEKRLDELSDAIADSFGAEQSGYLRELDEIQSRLHYINAYSRRSDTEKILEGLGFTPKDFGKPVGILSGGQKGRVAMAKLFVRAPKLLLLDEPTNFLDLAGTEWLEKFLHDYNGTYVVVSHDRYFLDSVCGKIWELENNAVQTWKGNYSKSRILKAEAQLSYEREYEKQKDFIERQEMFIRKNMAGQRSKEAKGRLKRLDRMERMDAPREDDRAMKLRLAPSQRGGMDVLHVENLQLSFGKDHLKKTIWKNLNFEIQRGERVGIIGANGSGKSSFLKVLTGEYKADTGKFKWGNSLQCSYYDQEHKGLNPQHSIFKEVGGLAYGISDEDIRTFLGAFLFSGPDVDKPISALSGGERARVSLAKILLSRPNVILFDEPTNHLDIPSCESLEQAILNYEGTCLIVSHDRYFLNRVATKILSFENGTAALTPGDYDAYKKWKAKQEEREIQARKIQPEGAAKVQKPVVTSRDDDVIRNRKQVDYHERKRMQKEYRRIEKNIFDAEERRKEIQDLMLKEDVYTNTEKSAALGRELKELDVKLMEHYQEWAHYADLGLE